MPNLFKVLRRKSEATASTTTPKLKHKNNRDSVKTPATVAAAASTPGGNNDDNDSLDSGRSSQTEQPFDVIPGLLSSQHSHNTGSHDDDDDEEDGSWTTSSLNQHQQQQNSHMPSEAMRQKIHQRMNILKENDELTTISGSKATEEHEEDKDEDTSSAHLIRLGKRKPVPVDDNDGDDDDDDDSTIPSYLPSEQRQRQRQRQRQPDMIQQELDLEDMPEDEKQDYLQGFCSGVTCGAGTADDEETKVADNLCDYMSAIHDICGTGTGTGTSTELPSASQTNTATGTSSPPKSVSPNTLIKRSLPQLKPPYGVEEQTAIEVEYIEPSRPLGNTDAESTASSSNPRKKAQFIKNMALKAKRDFENAKGRPAKVSSLNHEEDESTLDPLPTDTDASSSTHSTTQSNGNGNSNVYSSFSSAEKRKFLKWINSGLTPSEATAHVLQERNGGGAPVTATEPDERRAMSSSTSSPQPPVAPMPSSISTGADADADSFVRSGINYYDAVREDEGEEEDDDDEDQVERDQHKEQGKSKSTTNRSNNNIPPSKLSTRRSRLAKFGFSRLKNKQVDDEENEEEGQAEIDPEGTSRNEEEQQQEEEGTEAPTSREIVQDLEEHQAVAAESRSIFKPISPRLMSSSSSPPQDPEGQPPEARIQPSMSEDSLLHDSDHEGEKQRSFHSVPMDPEGEELEVPHEGEKQRSFHSVPMDPEGEELEVPPEQQVEEGPAAQPEEQEEEIVVPAEGETVIVVPPALDSKSRALQMHGDLYRLREEEEEEEQQEEEEEEEQQEEEEEEKREVSAHEPGAASRFVVGPNTLRSATPPRRMTIEDLDVETAYMNSTELMSNFPSTGPASVAGTSNGGDHTVRSHATYTTTGTNYTTSTRSRRPGASKQRISAQKSAEQSAVSKKYKGWQESIQEVAAGLGRVWDPVKGWVDYKEAEDEKKDDGLVDLPDYRSRGSASDAALNGSTTATSGSNQDSLRALPDKEETASLPSPQPQTSTRSTPAASAPRNPMSPPRHGAAISKKDTVPARSRGWMETMKEATAKLNLPGARWDPERGWIGPNEDGVAASVDRYQERVQEQAESDVQDFGMQTDDTHDFGTSPAVGAIPAAVPADSTGSGEENEEVKPTPREPSGQEPIHFLRQDPSGETLHIFDDSHSDQHSLDASIKSGHGGRYIQIGDTGSVSSYYFGKPSAKTPSRERRAPLEATPEGNEESGHNGSKQNNVLVDVKKEKVDQEEASLFPEVHRRSTGPVDLDEIDEQENGSFQGPSFSWDEDDFESEAKATSTPKRAEPVKEAKPGGSVASIPRLPGPKRDTTPIRGRGGGSQTAQATPTDRGAPQQVTPSPPTRPRPERPAEETAAASSTSSSPKPAQSSQRSRNPSPQYHDEDGNSNYPQPIHARTLFPPMRSQWNRESNMHHDDEQQPRSDPQQSSGRSPYSPMRSTSRRDPTSKQSQSNRAPLTPTDNSQPHGVSPDRSLKLSPDPASQDARSVDTEDDSPSVHSVKKLHDYWEKRSSDNPLTPPQNEWKTYLSKKAIDDHQRKRGTNEEDRDSLFEFAPDGSFSMGRAPRSNPTSPDRHHNDAGLRSLEEISNLSPIRTVHDDDDTAPSITSTEVVQGRTFMERIQACAAPIMPRDGINCNTMPMAHLAFMRNKSSATNPNKNTRAPPPNFCEKPDVIVEEDEDAVDDKEESTKTPSKQSQSKNRGDVSSVISDEQFGQKTAYLEAIAMKAAVSGSKKNRKPRSSSSEKSEKHSDSWQRFLDKKSVASSDSGDVKKAAERYTSEKFDTMLARNRSNEFQPRPMEEATGAFPSVGAAARKFESPARKSGYNTAAEDLAAARVEAMMHVISSPRTLDEGEGEI